MKKSFIKIISLLLIIGLNWTGLSAIGTTFAYFSDTGVSSINTFGMGSLDFSLRSGQGNFVPPEIASNMAPGQSVARDIYIKKQGSLQFKYKAHSEPVSGSCDSEFYDVLELRVWYNYYHTQNPAPPNYHQDRTMALKYNGLLKDFGTNPDDPDLRIPNGRPYFDNMFYGPDEHWLYFQITFPDVPGNYEITGKECTFKFVLDGWQTDLFSPSQGFSDTEEIYSTLVDTVFVEEELIDEEEELDSEEIVENEDETTETEDTQISGDEGDDQDQQDISSDSENEPPEDGEDVGGDVEGEEGVPGGDTGESAGEAEGDGNIGDEGEGHQDSGADEGTADEGVQEDAEGAGGEVGGEVIEGDVEDVAGESGGDESGEDVSEQDAGDIPEEGSVGESGDEQGLGVQEGDGGETPSAEGSPAVLPSDDGSGQGDSGEGGGSDSGDSGGDVGDSPSADSGEGPGDSGDAGDSGDSGDVGDSVSE